MGWILHEEADKAVISEIEKQSDRGAMLMASAFLEQRLEAAIKTRLDPDPHPDAINFIFRRGGPLAGFYAKIEMGLLLQLYPGQMRDLLHDIREIRNDAAHSTEPISFEHPSIRDRCRNLQKALSDTVWLGLEHIGDLMLALRSIPEPKPLRVLNDGGWESTSYSLRGDPDTRKGEYLAAVKAAAFHLHKATEVFAHRQVVVRRRASPSKPAEPPRQRAHGPGQGRKRQRRQRPPSPE